MAKPSRSSKKQPAFDPSELEDLIFSPAVGKGVGSHLVTQAPHLATVVTSDLNTVVPLPASISDLTTVVTTQLDIIDTLDVSTVVTPKLSSPGKPAKHRLWITENGDLVSEARVKRIRLAQDVINSAEENVYDTLWNSKLIQANERESCRIVQAGYDSLVKRTRLARKTIQRIIAKLLEKDFIAIETRADIYERTSTVYRVFSYKAVLEKHIGKGRTHVAKMGPGFSYVRLLDEPTRDFAGNQTASLDMTTVSTSIMPTVVYGDMATVVPQTTATMVKIDRPTVVNMASYLLDTDNLDSTSSSRVQMALSSYGLADDDVAQFLFNSCRQQAPDCTVEEIIHFIEEKGTLMERKRERVYNPVGFLVAAVPKCFSTETLSAYRRQKLSFQKQEVPSASEEHAAMQQWKSEQEAILSDPKVSEQEKHLIRLCLGLNSS